MRISIGKKLLLGFMLILLFLSVTSVLAINRMSGMGAKTEEINNIWLPKVTLLGQMNGSVSDVRGLLGMYVLETDSEQMEIINQKLSATLSDIEKQRKQFEKVISSKKEKEIYNRFSGQWDSYLQQLPPIQDAGSSDLFELANGLLKEADPFFDAANQDVSKLIKLNEEGARIASEQSMDLFLSGRLWTIIISVIAVVTGIVVAIAIARMIAKPVNELAKQVKEVAGGNLTVKDLKISSRDEIGTLVGDFNKMTNNLREIIGQVVINSQQVAATSEQLSASAEQTTSATEQIAIAIQEVANGSEHQVSSVHGASEVLKEITNGMGQIGASIAAAADSSVQANEVATNGNEKVIKAVQQMSTIHEKVSQTADVVTELGQRSAEIGQIVNLISTIAAQTNLLALNAAIEAARAGDHGKGFAVVADEVRKLAEESAKATRQITELIHQIQNETTKAMNVMTEGTEAVNEGITIVTEAGESFEDILQSVDHVSKQAQEVSAAVEQVHAGSQTLLEAMSNVSSISEQAAANSQNVAGAAEETNATMEEISSASTMLSRMAEELQTAVGRFKLN